MLKAVITTENQHQPKDIKHIPTIVGIVLSSTAILLYWYGSYTFTPLEYHMLTLPIFTAGLTLIFFNLQTLRQMAFPITFLLFLTPPPIEFLYTLGSTLSIMSSEVSYTIVSSLGIPSLLTNEYDNPVIQITRPNGATVSFTVDIACSGIFSLIGFLIFAVFTAYIIRDKAWKKLVLFLGGFSLIYILNITRITTILLIGYQWGEETALQLFHLVGSWILIFIGTLLLLAVAEKILHAKIFTKSRQKCEECNPSLKSSQNFCLKCGKLLKTVPSKFNKTETIKIATVILSTILLISIQVPVFALTEGPAQIIVQTPTGEQGNTQLLPQIQGYTLTFAYRDKNFEEKAKQDASLIYAYTPTDQEKQPVYIAVEIASATSSLHRWEVCLITYQITHERPASAIQLDLKDIQILQNPPIIARYFAFQWTKTNQTQVVFYWYESAIFITNSTSAQQKQVKISIITYPDSPENVTKSEDLLPFATAIAGHWEPIKAWSQIAVILSQYSIYIAAIVVAVLPAVTILYILKWIKLKKANKKAYEKLSEHNKEIIEATSETQKTTTPTLEAITITQKKKTNKPLEREELLQKLLELEEIGLIKRDIANGSDEPILVWKT
jgi:exosortase